MGRTTFALLTVLLLAAPGSASEYTDEVDAWHAGRIERLRQPDGWLSLVGLISLPEGRSSFGTAEGMDLRVASRAIVVASMANMVFKTVLVGVLGSRSAVKRCTIGFVILFVAGAVGIALI